MQVSAEIRWFWPDKIPDAVDLWFRNRSLPAGGGGEPRDDVYLHDPVQKELGIKRRGKKPGVEIKGLIGRASLAGAPSWVDVKAEIWCKWSSAVIDISGYATVNTLKVRWLRKFDTTSGSADEVELGADEMPLHGVPLPEQGCNIEFTRIQIEGNRRNFWTLGFEAFGDLETVKSNLSRALNAITPLDRVWFGSSMLLSYPEWLAGIA
jgi:hypothetical protein